MPSLIDLRRRIRSVKNTQQITKAMKMVSAAKLRRAQQQVLESRPYSRLLRDIVASVLSESEADESAGHPLLAKRPENKALLLLLSGDKGLCGAFNTNILKEARQFIASKGEAQVELELIGKKGRDYYARRTIPISGEWVDVFSRVELMTAQQIAKRAMNRYIAGEVDSVYILYSEFKSAVSQIPTLVQALPIEAPPAEAGEASGGGADYIYAQPPQELFKTLLPRYVEVLVYQAMLESAASEHSARMAAMEAATRNAGEMIDKLTLHLNRVRQASITTEIIEIVSGAAALE
ncbi:MAG: ATP synthase F1 subunit gamma [Acidobacteria bacterium]|nr:ATP synthase F1 subunit gamma [Acidobacteriota bacterium]